MRAVILAAGRGLRLKPHTNQCPKALIPIGGTTLIHRNIDILRTLGVTDISIVIGYLKEKFSEAFPQDIRFFTNVDYGETDQAASLLKARDTFRDDLIIVTADLFCPRTVYATLIESPAPICVAVDKRQAPLGGFDNTIEKVLFENGRIVQMGKSSVSNMEANGEFLGLTKIRKDKCAEVLETLEQAVRTSKSSASLVDIHQRFLDEGEEIDYVECTLDWCEVDDSATLAKARRLLEVSTFD